MKCRSPRSRPDFLSDDGALANPARAPGSGEALARVTDGTDANDDAEDFGVYRWRTPGELNPLLLTVTPAPITPGARVTMTVRGALPGATVSFGYERAPGQPPCPPSLGGLCLGVAHPGLLGTARSGIDRSATLSFWMPANTPVGAQVKLQAGVTGPEADVSTIWFDTVQP